VFNQLRMVYLIWKGCKMVKLRKMWVVLLYVGLVVCSLKTAAIAQTSEELNLPVDTTTRLVVRELRISGNTLISTGELLEYMPAVYNASGQTLSQADSQYLYDLRPIQQIVTVPGQPREVSLRTIQGLTQYILSVYQQNDYSGIYVYVPEGAIRNGNELVNGILPINILEAPVSEVRIKYYDAERTEVEDGYLRRSALEKWSPVEQDKVASQKELNYLVNLLNLNPDRHVSAVVSRGAEPNTLAIQYDVYETDPWHYFIQADNSGNEEMEWAPRAGIINTNFLGIDDKLIAWYKADLDAFDENYIVYGSYDFPVMGPRLRLNLYGLKSEADIQRYYAGAGDLNFLSNGTTYGAILSYNIYQERNWFFDITGSLSKTDIKIDKTFSLFRTKGDTEMDLWGIGFNVHHREDMSNTYFTLNYTDPIDVESEEDLLARVWDEDFSIFSASANHSQYLDQDKVQQLRGNFRWIVPTERLHDVHMTSFGGMYSVRGYDENEIMADGGLLASIQYEYDLVRHNQAIESETVLHEELKRLAPIAFLDYGRTKFEDPTDYEDANWDSETLLSVGFGVAFEVGNNFSAAVYCGVPLEDTPETNSGNSRISASAMLRW